MANAEEAAAKGDAAGVYVNVTAAVNNIGAGVAPGSQ